MQELGKILVVLGVLLVVAGVFLWKLAGRTPLARIPLLDADFNYFWVFSSEKSGGLR